MPMKHSKRYLRLLTGWLSHLLDLSVLTKEVSQLYHLRRCFLKGESSCFVLWLFGILLLKGTRGRGWERGLLASLAEGYTPGNQRIRGHSCLEHSRELGSGWAELSCNLESGNFADFS